MKLEYPRRSGNLCTHHNQGNSALFVGSIGSQDSQHHDDGAHDIEAEQTTVPTLQLRPKAVNKSQIWLQSHTHELNLFQQLCSHISSFLNAGGELSQQSEADDDAANNLNTK